MDTRQQYIHHHVDSGSDLDDDGEDARLTGSINGAQNGKGRTGAAAPSRLPQCCCRITPFSGLVMLLLSLGLALLTPGILMRMESIPSPSPLVLLNLCRQPAPYAAPVLDKFRNEISSRASVEGRELQYEGVSISTSALSVYRGSESYRCAEEEAYEGSQQVISLPDTLLYTGIKYVAFLTLPTYVVGGSINVRMYGSQGLLFNVTTSLHLHRYLARHDIVWLQASHTADELTKVYNPHLPPAPVHAHGVREEECRYAVGCSYRLRAGMQSLVLTSTAFEIPTPPLPPRSVLTAAQDRARKARQTAEGGRGANLDQELVAEEAEAEAEAALTNTPIVPGFRKNFNQDESMLIFANNLTLVIDYAVVIESNELAERASAHSPGPDGDYFFTPLTGAGGVAVPPTPEKRRPALTQFIAPDVLISFHQYELSPMQHVGVSYIIKGTVLLLTAIALAFVKHINDAQRSKPKHS